MSGFCRCVLFLWLPLACTGTSEPVETPPAKTSDSRQSPARPEPIAAAHKRDLPPEPHPKLKPPEVVNAGTHPAHACQKPDDCTSSCSLGAVNKFWYEIHYPDGDACEDGCTSKGFEAPRCEQNVCTSYRQGSLVPECTAQPVVYRDIQHSPAYRCKTGADCNVTCMFGATNAAYFQQHLAGGPDCRDGCTAKGTEAPQCQNGLCVGYRLGNPQPYCTRKSVESE